MTSEHPSPAERMEALQRGLATGWNTWNTQSVLSHVLLPDGVAVDLVFKHYAAGDVLREALVGRHGDDAERLHPGPRTYDGGYTDLRLRWRGCAWRIESAARDDELVLLITPESVNEPRPPLVAAELGLLWNRPGTLGHGPDGCLEACTPKRRVRLHGTGDAVAEPYLAARGPFWALPADRPAGFATGTRRSLEDVQQRIAEARAARLAQRTAWGEAAEARDAMQTCLAWDTVYDPRHGRVISPVSRLWNLKWGGYVLFCWDSYFAASMAALDHKELAYANAWAVTREGIANGFVPNFVSPNGCQSRDRSQPPVGALVVRDLYRRHGDAWFVAALFDDLMAWNRWWPAHRQVDGLLAWGTHPYAPVVGHRRETVGVNRLAGAALESGLDNAPMYDDLPFDPQRHVMLLQDVGLNSLYVADCEALAELAGVLGRSADAAELNARGTAFREAMQRLWDERTGLFLNRRTDTGAFEHRLSPTHFYPLLAGAATPAQARRMVDEHFLNPREFQGRWMLPSCARNDPAYPEQNYWRGRVWAPMNYLVYLGLCRYGLSDARRMLAESSHALLLGEWSEFGHVHENYDAETGRGCGVTSSDAFYHWGGLLGLIAVLEADATAAERTPSN